jgi:2,3-bisphosphoglycerate-independent phosphoglycerate mutase
MDVIEVAGATGFIDTNYAGKVAAGLKALEDHDLVYIHVEAIDECSHMGDMKLKLQAIEDFDSKIVAPVLAALKDRKDVRFAILPDHPVPLSLRKHTTTPVPLAVCGCGIAKDATEFYGESVCPAGALGKLAGDALVKLLLGL